MIDSLQNIFQFDFGTITAGWVVNVIAVVLLMMVAIAVLWNATMDTSAMLDTDNDAS